MATIVEESVNAAAASPLAKASAPRLRWLGLALLHVALPIVVGGLIYALWRGSDLVMVQWAKAVHLDGAARAIRELGAPSRPRVPSWVLYNVPDAAWSYALGGLLALLWSGRATSRGASRGRVPWLVVGGLMVAAVEPLQWAGLVPGTFDWVDLVVSCLGYGAAVIVVSRMKEAH